MANLACATAERAKQTELKETRYCFYCILDMEGTPEEADPPHECTGCDRSLKAYLDICGMRDIYWD